MEVLIVLFVVGLFIGGPVVLLLALSSHFERQSGRFDALQSAVRELRDEIRLMRQGAEKTEDGTGEPPKTPFKPETPPKPAGPPLPYGPLESPAADKPEPERPRRAQPVYPWAESGSEKPSESDRVPDESAPVYTAKVVGERPSYSAPLPEIRRRRPSAVEIRARKVLRKTWNWIIVGEEYIPKGVSMEYAVATQWLARIGVLILVIGLGFFLAYAIDQGYLGPEGRVALITFAGFGMLIAGTRMLGRKYHVLGQGLLGAGTAALYGAVFAAFRMHHLIEQVPAFALMSGVTVLSAAIAIRFRSLLTAVLGAIGGYLTPVLLSTGVVDFVGLYAYLLILSLGMLGIAIWRDWPILRYISFIGSWGLVITPIVQGDYEVANFWQVMPFLIAFFVVFSTMSFISQVTHRRRTSLMELGHLCAGAAVFFCVGYWMIRNAYGRMPTAYLTVGLSTYYTCHVWWFLSRKRPDRALLIGCVGLAAFFLAVTMPIVLSKEWLTASWAVTGLILLWIGYRLKSPVVRGMAYVLDTLVVIRFGVVDLPRQYAHSVAAGVSWAAYWPEMLRRMAMFSVPVGCFAGAYGLVRANESKALPQERNWDAAMLLGAVAGLFLMLHLEIARTFGAFVPEARVPMLTMLWIGLCLFLLAEAIRRKTEPWLMLFCVAAGGLAAKLLAFDLPSWSHGRMLVESFVFGNGTVYVGLDALMRLWDCAAVLAMCWFVFARLRGGNDLQRHVGRLFAAAAVVVLFIFTTLELSTVLTVFAPGLRDGGISVLWSIFALSLVTFGIAKDVRTSRYVGLALFTVVVGKVFIVDLSRATQVARVIAFVALGTILMCGSFVYLKSRDVFSLTAEKEREKEVEE